MTPHGAVDPATLDKVFRYVDLRALVAGYGSACADGDWMFAQALLEHIERDGSTPAPLPSDQYDDGDDDGDGYARACA